MTPPTLPPGVAWRYKAMPMPDEPWQVATRIANVPHPERAESLHTADQMLAFWEAGRLAGMEEAAKIADLSALDTPYTNAATRYRALSAAIRAAASRKPDEPQRQWGTAFVSTPEYQAEQREKNRRVRALMDDAAMGRKPDGSAA